MKKRILSFLLLCMAAVGVSAESTASTLNINQKSGGTVSYAFSEKPVVTMSGNNVVITTTSTSVEYPISNLQDITFTASTDGIVEVLTAPKADGPTYIYNTAGVLLKTIPAGQTFNFECADKGMYIIKNNNTTYKIIKK